MAKGVGFFLVCVFNNLNKGVLSLFFSVCTKGTSLSTKTSKTIFTIVNNVVCIVVQREKEITSLAIERVLVVTTFSLCFKFTDRNISGMTRVNNLLDNFLVTMVLCRPEGV